MLGVSSPWKLDVEIEFKRGAFGGIQLGLVGRSVGGQGGLRHEAGGSPVGNVCLCLPCISMDLALMAGAFSYALWPPLLGFQLLKPLADLGSII